MFSSVLCVVVCEHTPSSGVSSIIFLSVSLLQGSFSLDTELPVWVQVEQSSLHLCLAEKSWPPAGPSAPSGSTSKCPACHVIRGLTCDPRPVEARHWTQVRLESTRAEQHFHRRLEFTFCPLLLALKLRKCFSFYVRNAQELHRRYHI